MEFPISGQTTATRAADLPHAGWRFAAWLLIASLAMPPAALVADPSRLGPPTPVAAAENPFVWHKAPPFMLTAGAWTPWSAAPPTVATFSTRWAQAASASPSAATSATEMDAPWTPEDLSFVTSLLQTDGDVPANGMPIDPLPGGIPILENVAGNCIITGEVSDAVSLDPIAGATVEIIGAGRLAETDGSGRFKIEGIAPGTYTLEATQLGYFTETSVVTTIEAQPAETRFGLRAKPVDDTAAEYTLEEETVVGEYQGDSTGDLFMDLQVAPSISAEIGKEEFSRAAVSDAAGAVSKISGANIVGGRYAVIRGLGDRYSNTTVNGSLISSADPSRKAVQLDLFPSHLLESIKINKTFLPNLPGEFAGGLVAIQTLKFPDEPIVEFKYGQGYNSNLSGDERFLEIGGRDLGFWAKTNQGELPDANFGILTATGSSGATNAQRKALMDQIHSSQGFRATEGKSDGIEDSMEFTLGRSFDLSQGVKLGAVFAFTHEQGDSAVLGYEVGRNFDASVGANRRGFEYDSFTRAVSWGVLLGAGLKLGDEHEIGYTYFKNRTAEDTVNQASRVMTANTAEILMVNGKPQLIAKLQSSRSGPFGAGYAVYRGFDQIEPVIRDLEVNQITGRHHFGEDKRGPRMDWALAKSDSLEERPQTSTYYYSQMDFTDPRIKDQTFIDRRPNPAPPPRFINVQVPEIYQPERGIVNTAADVLSLIPPEVESFRESLKTEEEATDAIASLMIPFYFSEANDDRFELGFGAGHFNKTRQVRGNFLVYRVPQQVNSDLYLQTADGGQAGIDDATNANSNQLPNGSDRFSGNFADQTRPRYEDFGGRGFTERNVNAGTGVTSAFVMGNLLLDQWELAGGLRRESETRYYELLSTTGSLRERGEQTNDYLLSGVSLSRPFGDDDKHSAQIAWSRTVARPTFYEFAPVFTKDQATGDQIAGNPNLVDSLITNIDLAYSYTPTPGTRFGANLFQKDIQDPIVKVLQPTGEITWVNGSGGEVRGFELEVEQRIMERWSLTANYTFLDSLLEVTKPSAGREISFESTFEGQPDQIVNVILGYDHEEWGLRTSLVYNYTGQYLVALANDPSTNPSVVELPRHTLDFVISKDFNAFNTTGTLSFKIGNLLDSKVERVNEGQGDAGLYDRYRPGRDFSLSCKFAF